MVLYSNAVFTINAVFSVLLRTRILKSIYFTLFRNIPTQPLTYPCIEPFYQLEEIVPTISKNNSPNRRAERRHFPKYCSEQQFVLIKICQLVVFISSLFLRFISLKKVFFRSYKIHKKTKFIFKQTLLKQPSKHSKQFKQSKMNTPAIRLTSQSQLLNPNSQRNITIKESRRA